MKKLSFCSAIVISIFAAVSCQDQRKAKNYNDKTLADDEAIKRLTNIAQRAEQDFTPNANFDKVIEEERNNSWKYGGRTVFGKAKPPTQQQLKLF